MDPIKKNIYEALQLETLPPEEQEEVLERIGILIYQNVLARSIEQMTAENQNVFESMLDKNAEPPEIFNFLKENVPNFEKIITEEAEKLKDKAVGIMDQIG